MILEVIDKPLYISWKWTSKLYTGDTQPHEPHEDRVFCLPRKLTEQQQSEPQSQVGLASHKVSL